jgi:lipoate-protein ligase A
MYKNLKLITDSSKCRIILSQDMHPPLIIGLGEYVMKSDTPSLFITRARPSIIFGVNQNPYLECNIPKIKEDGISLIRRGTGGGCVYEGTLMIGFTGRQDHPNFNCDNINKIITSSFSPFLKYPAEAVGKNDIKCHMNDTYHKIAGQTFKYSRGYYKYTLSALVNTNMNAISKYLTPNKLKMQSKGIKSARTNVINMIDIAKADYEGNLCDDITLKLVTNFEYYFGLQNNIINIVCSDDNSLCKSINKHSDNKTNILDESDLYTIPEIKNICDYLTDDKTIYGQTPDFTHEFEGRFSWGTISVRLFVEDNKIKDVHCYTDSIIVELPIMLKEILVDCNYARRDVEGRFNDRKEEELKDIKELLIKELV